MHKAVDRAWEKGQEFSGERTGAGDLHDLQAGGELADKAISP
jgi:hypothetical protein